MQLAPIKSRERTASEDIETRSDEDSCSITGDAIASSNPPVT